MKIAIPTDNDLLCSHFGHCSEFTVISVDENEKIIKEKGKYPSPDHQPGLLPAWLQEKGADLVIAGGMGMHAQHLFAQYGIKVIVGAPVASPDDIIEAYLNGSLKSGRNICDH